MGSLAGTGQDVTASTTETRALGINDSGSMKVEEGREKVRAGTKNDFMGVGGAGRGSRQAPGTALPG